MNEPDIRSAFVEYMSRWIGDWYKWGGDDPSGWDCSGHVIEGLKAFGKFPRKKDNTANGLLHRYSKCEVGSPRKGCLIFWVDSGGRAYHVEVASGTWDNKWFSIGAKGGGSSTLTVSDAIRQNAFIKQREFDPTDPKIVMCDPFKEAP